MQPKQADISVIEANGLAVPFSVEKVWQSLIRAGATPEISETVIDELYTRVYPYNRIAKLEWA